MFSETSRKLTLFLLPALAAGAPLGFLQTNLVSDLPGVALTTDPNLQNPWGIASSASSPFWVADNKTGVSTLYNTAGQIVPLVVTIPPPAGAMGPSAPTGAIFNSTADFGGSRFLFATEDGTIAGWSAGTSASLGVDNSGLGAVYKGIALANNGASNLLYAANFNSGKVDVFGPNFAPVVVAGGFKDATLPAGYAPFNIQNIGGKLYVTYALQNAAKHDDVAGAGNGYVDVFDANGNLLSRLVSKGALNSPWGLALAGANFGPFSNDLLVGNFGDGVINAFDPNSGAFLGSLTDGNGAPLVNKGLWGLRFGNGGPGGNTNTLYLAAGIPGPGAVEDHGLFAQLQPIPEPRAVLLIAGGIALIAIRRRATAA